MTGRSTFSTPDDAVLRFKIREDDPDLKDGGRLLSRYDTDAGSFYVITEWGRSMTTLMLREEY